MVFNDARGVTIYSTVPNHDLEHSFETDESKFFSVMTRERYVLELRECEIRPFSKCVESISEIFFVLIKYCTIICLVWFSTTLTLGYFFFRIIGLLC
jgi:hypothetical protein